MSVNIWDAESQEVKQVAGVANINDGAISEGSTWSSKKIDDEFSEVNVNLGGKQDFRIFKSLEEFNEKKGTSFTVVSGVDNMVDIANAMSEGDMLIITTKYTSGSEIYFGLDSSTGWTKMFTLTRIGGLCDIKCTTSAEKNLTRVLAGSTLTAWQELATMGDVVKQVMVDARAFNDIASAWSSKIYPYMNTGGCYMASVITKGGNPRMLIIATETGTEGTGFYVEYGGGTHACRFKGTEFTSF